MKAWIVNTDYSEGSEIIFANTRNEARIEAMYCNSMADERYIDIKAHRLPELDGMENYEPRDNPWLNEEIRIILVKERV